MQVNINNNNNNKDYYLTEIFKKVLFVGSPEFLVGTHTCSN